MSTGYKDLEQEDILLEKDLENLQKSYPAKSFTGLKKLQFASAGALILALAAFAGSAYLYRQLHHEMRQREALEASEIQLREKNQALEKSLKQSQEEAGGLKSALFDFQSLKKNYAKLQQDSEAELQTSRTEKKAVEDKLKELEKKVASEAMKKAADKAQTEIDLKPLGPPLPANSSAAVSSLTPSKSAAPGSAAGKIAQVLTVNRKFNFLVLNLGLRDGIKLGDTLRISRNGKQIGTASVEKIYDNFSAAAITQESKESLIREGDSTAKT